MHLKQVLVLFCQTTFLTVMSWLPQKTIKTPQELDEPWKKYKSPPNSSFHFFRNQWSKAFLARKVIHWVLIYFWNIQTDNPKKHDTYIKECKGKNQEKVASLFTQITSSMIKSHIKTNSHLLSMMWILILWFRLVISRSFSFYFV